MNIGRPQNESARTQIKIAFVPLIISPGIEGNFLGEYRF